MHGATAGSRAAWRDHDDKQRCKSFDRKTDTKKHLATVEADLLRGTSVDPRSVAKFPHRDDDWDVMG